MPSKIAKLVGYTKAPKATFMVRHPVKGAKTLFAAKGLKGFFTTRPGAVLSAMLAIPLLLVRRRRRKA